MNSESIKIKKKLNDINKLANKQIKKDCCFLCGAKCDSFINSHSIPHYMLKEISNNGFLYSPSTLIDELKPILHENIGKKAAGTFHSICKKCDNDYFDIYEEIDSIKSLFQEFKLRKISIQSQKLLASIFLKSLLKDRYNKEKELVFFIDGTKIYNDNGIGVASNRPELIELTLLDYDIEISECKQIINGTLTNDIILYDSFLLDYTVPIATQSLIPIQKDLKGNIVNNVLSNSKNIHIKEICICVFPIKHKTYIFIFGLKSNKNLYQQFFRQYRSNSKTNRLKLIQTILFSYNEEVYFSNDIHNILSKDIKMKKYISEGVVNNKVIHYENFDFTQTGIVNIKGFKELDNFLFEKKFSKEFYHRR